MPCATARLDPKRVPRTLETAREPKASRVRVWQAVERIVRAGRRPTIEGVREILGGGSPNSVTAYINDWYRDLGGRLDAADAPMLGLPSEAVSLLAELWRLAAGSRTPSAGGAAADELREAERLVLIAETKALETLNKELQKHRATAEKSLAEARALLSRREAALEEERSHLAVLEQALAQARLDLEVTLERQRLAPARMRVPPRTRPSRNRPKPARGARTKVGRKAAQRKKLSQPVETKRKRAARPAVPKRRRTQSAIKKRR